MKKDLGILFFTPQEVLEIHDNAIQTLGGRSGIHDKNLLESAVNQPEMVLHYGKPEEKELWFLAATYFFHII